jgi:hypothetical protein
MTVGDSIRNAESGGDNNARNPNSSAYGPDQFLAGTWLDTLKATRPDLAQGKSDAEILALRSDPVLSGQMRDAYAASNNAILTKAGLPVTPGTTYLAHFAGPSGAVKLLSADPSTPAGEILGSGVVAANPFLAKMTAGDVAAWASRRVGGATPAQAPQAAPQAPLSLQPPQAAAPIFPPQAPPQAAQQAAPQGGGFQIPDIQAPPIFYAQRKAPDLSRLRASFKPPIFS